MAGVGGMVAGKWRIYLNNKKILKKELLSILVNKN